MNEFIKQTKKLYDGNDHPFQLKIWIDLENTTISTGHRPQTPGGIFSAAEFEKRESFHVMITP